MKFARFKAVLATATGVALFSGCGASSNKPTFEYMPHMMDSVALKRQGESIDGHYINHLPPAGTIARDQENYQYMNDPEAAGRNLSNPVRRTMANLKKGEHLFNTYCIVCHGSRGEGNGFVVPKFPSPPSLQSEKVRNWPDGNIYHVITAGQNLMRPYSTVLAPEERWQIVNYVRVLQRALNPTDADIAEISRGAK